MEDDALGRYREMRDFTRTPEPAGEPPPGGPGAAPRFVVQEHHARSMHWDLRLERDGTLVSFAIPRGLPDDPKRNHLAVHTEDHPLEYLTFSGEIPAGEYGGGTMTVWDTGTYEPHKFRDDEVIVTLHGERAQGKYALFRTKGKDWMIHRMDPPADPSAEPMPTDLTPMLATIGPLPTGDGWAYEIKWDGIRALAWCEGGRCRLRSRTGRDITATYPEIRPLGRQLGSRKAILDGEIVAFDAGRPSFEQLQQRMNVSSDAAVRRLRAQIPVVYVIFDVLWLEGHTITSLPYRDRRRLLEALKLQGDSWQVPANHTGDGSALLEATRAQGLEGVVAKRLDSRYEPGRRSPAWRKVKHTAGQEFVVGGWLPGKGKRAGSVGALLIGVYGEAGVTDPGLVYAGRVGTGFSDAELDRLDGVLAGLAADASPFAEELPAAVRREGPRYCRPDLVVEVEFAEWTRSGVIRAPRYHGSRPDKLPADVVRELPDYLVRPSLAGMNAPSERLYFRQLLAGRDFAREDPVARQMVNFVYLVGDKETGEAVVIDPAYGVGELLDILAADEMRLTGVLATHYHPDHVGGDMMGMSIQGVRELLESEAVPVHVQRDEAEWVKRVTGLTDAELTAHSSGDVVPAGAIDVTLVHTPGHTPGSQCFLVENRLVSGDTLFLDGCGRTDLPGGDPLALYESLTQRLAHIPDTALLFPGHLYSAAGVATMGATRESNFVFKPKTPQEWLRLFG